MIIYNYLAIIIYPYFAIIIYNYFSIIIYPYFAIIIYPYFAIFSLCLPYRVISTHIDHSYPYYGYISAYVFLLVRRLTVIF